jgi:CheY-like chemotaxis protein
MSPGTPRILVAEDNPINQEVLLEQLSQLGHAADVADDGRQALSLWLRQRHPLVLTDLQMPDMDGYDLALAIRAHEARQGGPRTHIVALTAGSPKQVDPRVQAAGIDAQLIKPVSLDALGAHLAAWLSNGAAVPPVAARVETADTPAPLLDADLLRQYVGDDPETLAHFRQDFLQRLAALRSAMGAAWARSAVADLGGLAHQLKSAARTVGALQLAQGCEALEQAARAGDRDGTASAWSQVARAADDTDRVLSALLVRAA